MARLISRNHVFVISCSVVLLAVGLIAARVVTTEPDCDKLSTGTPMFEACIPPCGQGDPPDVTPPTVSGIEELCETVTLESYAVDVDTWLTRPGPGEQCLATDEPACGAPYYDCAYPGWYDQPSCSIQWTILTPLENILEPTGTSYELFLDEVGTYQIEVCSRGERLPNQDADCSASDDFPDPNDPGVCEQTTVTVPCPTDFITLDKNRITTCEQAVITVNVCLEVDIHLVNAKGAMATRTGRVINPGPFGGTVTVQAKLKDFDCTAEAT